MPTSGKQPSPQGFRPLVLDLLALAALLALYALTPDPFYRPA